MTDEPYTNLDLATADEILVRAGHGEIARALRFQTQGNRNLIQGEWGTRVVESFENILQTQVVKALASIQSTLDQQHDLVQQNLAISKHADKTARQALTVSKAGAARLGKLSDDLGKLNDEVTALNEAMAESRRDRADLRQRIDQISADRMEVAQIKQELAELKAWKEAQERGHGE